jgi:nucleoside phosphorylase
LFRRLALSLNDEQQVAAVNPSEPSGVVGTAVILTALGLEFQAVRAFLTDVEKKTVGSGTVYECGTFKGLSTSWRVIVAETGPGNIPSALHTERALAQHKPDALIFIGIAGGMKDVVIGDVVAATKVYGYESGKQSDEFLARPNVWNSSHSIRECAKAVARNSDWKAKLGTSDSSPTAFVGPIASGEKVLSSKDSDLFSFLKRNCSDALAVEMEAYGCLEAASAHPEVEVLIVRGISDLIEHKLEADQSGSQQIAATHASAFAFAVLGSFTGFSRLKGNDRAERLSLPTLSDEDRACLDRPGSRGPHLVETATATERPAMAPSDALAQHLSARSEAEGLRASISQSLTLVEVDRPPKLVSRTARQATVRALHEKLASCNWLALHGSVGCGKTQLAILMAESHDPPCIWIRFRDLSLTQARLRLTRALQQLAPSNSTRSLVQFIGDSVDALSEHAPIVLDDLPRLSSDEEFTWLLVRLAEACHNRTAHILSTSHFALPPCVAELLEPGCLTELAAPPFSDGEVSELLPAHGAPPSLLTEERIRFLNLLGEGNATILTAIARYLAAQNWTFDRNRIDALFARHHLPTVLSETTARLLATIDDLEARRLLYRLALVVGSFTDAEVDAVARVNPQVTPARERLHPLLGLWIQSDSGGKMAVSPLVKPLTNTELGTSEHRATHLALANLIAGKRKIDMLEAGTVVLHLFAARAFDRAALFLIRAFDSARNLPSDDLGMLLALSYTAAPLPAEMDHGLRLYLRSVQIRTYVQICEDPPRMLLAEVDELIETSGADEMWAVFIATSELLPILARTDIRRALEYLARAISVYPKIRIRGHRLPQPSDETCWANLIWFPIAGITSPSALLQWVSTLERLSPDDRSRAFRDAGAEAGCNLVVNQVWHREADKPADQRDWASLLESLKKVSAEARRLGIPLLHAMATRSRIVVLGEYLDDLDASLGTANAILADQDLDARSRFLIADAIGQQFLFKQRYDDANRWLEQAHAIETTAYPDFRLISYLRRSAAVATRDSGLAVALTENAVAIARDHPKQVGAVLMTIALGELAIARTLGSQLSGAFDAIGQAFEGLLMCRDESDSWKRICVLLGHVGRYIFALASTGRPPDEASEGSPYAPPFRCMLLSSGAQLAAHFRPEHLSHLYVLLADTASSLDDDDRAAKWASQGLDVVRAEGSLAALGLLAHRILPSMLRDHRYADAISTALEGCVAMTAAQQHGSLTGTRVWSGLDAKTILGGKPNESWNQAEQDAVAQSAIPTMFGIGSVANANREEAAEHARLVAGMCNAIATTASCPELWRGAAQMFAMSFFEGSNFRDLNQRANEAGKLGLRLVQVLGYIGISLQPNVPLSTSALSQVLAMPYVARVLSDTSPMYRNIVLPFICEFWRCAFQRGRFLFTAPRLVGEALESAFQEPESRRAQVVLRVVTQGLGVRFPANVEESAKAWLGTTDGV